MKNYYTYIKIALVVLLLGFIVFDMRRDPISNAQIDTVEKSSGECVGLQGCLSFREPYG